MNGPRVPRPRLLFAGGVLAASVCLSAVAPAFATPAAAAIPEAERGDALWYATDWFNFDKLKQRGATGAGVKIAVIDEAVNPNVPELEGANIRVMGSTCIDPATDKPWEAVNTDPAISAHGTNVVAMLLGNGKAGDGGLGTRGIAPDAEVMFYGIGPIEERGEDGRRSYWDQCVKHDPTVKPGEKGLVGDLEGAYAYKDMGTPDVIDNSDGHLESLAKTDIQFGDASALAARAAIRDGADVISISVDSGDVNAWDQVMIEALRAGVPVVMGTSNPAPLFSDAGMKIYQVNGGVKVNAITRDGEPLFDPSTGDIAMGWKSLAGAAPGMNLLGVGTESDGWGPELVHGTSYATPLVAGTIALGVQQFPKASQNQILQALIRTTNRDGIHEPEWVSREIGYGFINPAGLLNSDPTKYPDENPLYVTSYEDSRCADPDGGASGMGDGGRFDCYWAETPTPVMEEKYWAEHGEPADSGGDTEPGQAQNAVPGWVWAAGGAGLLVIIAAGVLVPVLVTRSRRARNTAQASYAGQAQSEATNDGSARYPGEG